MKNPDDPNAIRNDVLHSESHAVLSSQEIAKAVARHKREHPSKAAPSGKPKKNQPSRG